MVSILLYDNITWAKLGQEFFYLDGRDCETSLGSIFGWAKTKKKLCTNVTFYSRSDEPLVSCAGASMCDKLRPYIENGDMRTVDYPDKPEMKCFQLTAYAHCPVTPLQPLYAMLAMASRRAVYAGTGWS